MEAIRVELANSFHSHLKLCNGKTLAVCFHLSLLLQDILYKWLTTTIVLNQIHPDRETHLATPSTKVN